MLESIAVVLSGEAGSRLARQFGMQMSADSLLRRAKKLSLTPPSTPRVLGEDAIAFRREHTFGTILLNLETHQPVDLLQDRSAETCAEWLRQHPGVEISSRDRSTVKSVGGGGVIDKRVSQFELPNGVKSLMRRSPPGV
jgi:hypothetical protein